MKFLQIASLLIFTTIAPICCADEDSASNRLSLENSPYLLMHAHNPVDWFPWGPEALEKAKNQDKLIFLSVGYSSCYWCHVMERNVFSREDIAAWMNEHFVNVKVDREERPDVDDIYMTSLLVYQQLTGHRGGGGWPLSMFLTPDGDPFAGATYLHPEDQPGGRPGFLTAARRINDAWLQRRDDVIQTAQLISAEVRRLSRPKADTDTTTIGPEVVSAAVSSVQSLYDQEWGGVDLTAGNRQGPRFPNAPRLLLLMEVIEGDWLIQGDDAAATRELLTQIVSHSLTRMARGGIRDHLAGGFHRYSTDRRWHVPHFEKMLYDQAMLLEGYTRAGRLTGIPLFRTIAAEIADFVLAEFVTAEGGFCSALDAETNAIEGEYYVWQDAEIDALLSAKDAAVFKSVYGLTEPSPFEHGYVLYLTESLEDAGRRLQIPVSRLPARLSNMRHTLLEARQERQRPLLDDKVLTAWNALMIRALAISGIELNRRQDVTGAENAAKLLLKNLRTPDGQLLRSWRRGKAAHNAYLDDYAFFVSALIALHDATGNPQWLQHARELNQQQIERFYDPDLNVFCFTASDHERLIARTSSPFDSVFPSGNSVAIRNLIRLSGDDADLGVFAQQTLRRFVPAVLKSPASCSGMAMAVHDWLAAKRSADTAELPRIRQQLAAVLSVADDGVATNDGDDDSEADQDTSSDTVVPVTTFRPALNPDGDRPSRRTDRKKLLKVNVYPMYNKLPRGEKCMVALELIIRDGWHIQANPPHPDFTIPTAVTLKTEQKVRLTRVKYPAHKLHHVKGKPEPYHVYDGKILVYGLLEIDAAEKADKATLEFHIRFQTCNDDLCRPPDKIVIKGQLPLADPDDDIRKIFKDKFQKPKPGQESGKD